MRNHVVVLAVDGISTGLPRNVSHMIKGTLDLKHPYDDLEFGDLELFFRIMTGMGTNPKVTDSRKSPDLPRTACSPEEPRALYKP